MNRGGAGFGSFLDPAGAAARAELALHAALIAGAGLLFAATMALLAWAVLRRADAPRRVRPLHWLAGGGLLLPLGVLGALFVANVRHDPEASAVAPPGSPVVGVAGRLWWWELRWYDPRGGAPVVLANELRLPVGRAVRLALASDDVIHSLWVGPLAGKVDLVPGRVQHLVWQADAPGRWSGPCAEFCGVGHARMALTVIALPEAQFDAWLEQQSRDALPPRTPQQAEGARHFTALGCDACHTIRGHVVQRLAPPAGGPDLTHLASRERLGAGVLANDAAGLRAWITGVQQLKPGARMPAYPQLPEPVLAALVAYLAGLE